MAFIYRCPFCTFEHRGEHSDVGRKTQCQQCDFAFKIPAPAPADVIAAPVPQPRDNKTLLLCGGALIFVVLLGGGLFGLYHSRFAWEAKHHNEVVQLSSEAEDALSRGDEQAAYTRFDRIAALAKGQTHMGDDLQALVTRANTEDAALAKIYGPLTAATAPTSAPAPKPKTVAAAPRTAATATSAPSLLALLQPTPLGVNLSAEQIVSRYAKSVARIKSPVGSGTGFVAGPRMIVTNYHVVADSPLPQLKIYFPSSDDPDAYITPAALLYADGKRDLAVLSADTSQRPLQTAQDYAFKPGQSVVVIGNPGVDRELILQNAVSAGIMSTRQTLEGFDYYQMSIAINPGNSGGPVFDNNGAVVGVVTLKARWQEGIAFAIPASDLVKAIAAAGAASPEDSAKITSNHNLIAVCRRVSMMSGVYLAVMGLYVNAMHDAGPAGVPKALADAKSQVQAKLSKADAEAMADIGPMVQGYIADATIPKATRDKLAEVWAMCQETKTSAENPKGPAAQYETQLTHSTARRKRAFTDLQKALGVDDLLDDDQ